MKLSGRLWKDGSYWLIECPALQAVTQGRTKRDALDMMVDWVRTSLDNDEFPVEIMAGPEDTFAMRFADPKPVGGLIIERARNVAGLTLDQLAKSLGVKSRSTAAHYESGKHAITIDKLSEVFEAMGMEIEIDVKQRA